MPNLIRHFFIILSFALATQCLAKNSPDTILKNSIDARQRPLTIAVNRAQDIWDGLKSIRSDSVEKGVHQLVQGAKITFVRSKLNLISNYTAIEFFSLLNIQDEGKLSTDEKNLAWKYLD